MLEHHLMCGGLGWVPGVREPWSPGCVELTHLGMYVCTHAGLQHPLVGPRAPKGLNHRVNLMGKPRPRLALGFPPIRYVSVEQPHVPSPAGHL